MHSRRYPDCVAIYACVFLRRCLSALRARAANIAGRHWPGGSYLRYINPACRARACSARLSFAFDSIWLRMPRMHTLARPRVAERIILTRAGWCDAREPRYDYAMHFWEGHAFMRARIYAWISRLAVKSVERENASILFLMMYQWLYAYIRYAGQERGQRVGQRMETEREKEIYTLNIAIDELDWWWMTVGPMLSRDWNA